MMLTSEQEQSVIKALEQIEIDTEEKYNLYRQYLMTLAFRSENHKSTEILINYIAGRLKEYEEEHYPAAGRVFPGVFHTISQLAEVKLSNDEELKEAGTILHAWRIRMDNGEDTLYVNIVEGSL